MARERTATEVARIWTRESADHAPESPLPTILPDDAEQPPRPAVAWQRPDDDLEDPRDRGISVAPPVGRSAMPTECRNGWAEDPVTGTPAPCPICRPHLRHGSHGWYVDREALSASVSAPQSAQHDHEGPDAHDRPHTAHAGQQQAIR